MTPFAYFIAMTVSHSGGSVDHKGRNGLRHTAQWRSGRRCYLDPANPGLGGDVAWANHLIQDRLIHRGIDVELRGHVFDPGSAVRFRGETVQLSLTGSQLTQLLLDGCFQFIVAELAVFRLGLLK